MKPRLPGLEMPVPPLLTEPLLAECELDGVRLTFAIPRDDSVDHIELPLSWTIAGQLRAWLDRALA